MIKKLLIKGFQSHSDSEIDLCEGVNIIVGSTDVGKSSIVRGIQWVVFNRPTGTSFVNLSANECSVSIVNDKGTITRQRVPKNSYILNGNILTAIGTSTPSEINDVVNLNDINFQSQLTPYFLVVESYGSFSRNVSSLLGLDTVDLAIAKVKSWTQSVKSELESSRLNYDEALKSLDKLSVVDRLSSIYSSIEKFFDDLNEIKARHERLLVLSGKIKSVSTELDQASKFLDKFSSVYDEADKLFNSTYNVKTALSKISSSIDKITRISSELDSLNSSLENHLKLIKSAKAEYVSLLIEMKTCPICYSSLNETDVARLESKLEEL